MGLRERVEHPDSRSEMASLAIGVLSMPRPIDRVEAFVAFPGEGESWRLTHPIDLWNSKKPSAGFFLIAGYNTREMTSETLDVTRLQRDPYNLRRLRGVHICPHAEHSKEQVEEIFKKIEGLSIRSVALFVTPYHLLRIYLTLLKSLMVHGKDKDVQMIPAPIPISLTEISPENSVSMWDLIPGEINRIGKYQAMGDVATLPELQTYLRWLWGNPHSLLKPIQP